MLIMPATHDFSCLGQLGQRSKDSIISIGVTSPNVAEATKVIVTVTGIIANKCRQC